MIVIFSACSARKDDEIPIPEGVKASQPSDYLHDVSIERFQDIRNQILSDPRARIGNKPTFAFDLYVRTGNAYKDLRTVNYKKSKSLLISGEINWFFLSGGYGILNALESARKYQATFNRNIAYQKNIPFTANLWKGMLTKISDGIIRRFNPKHIYIFGSKGYTDFIKQTCFWVNRSISGISVKMFESTGSAGPYWLSPKLNELINSITFDKLVMFNKKYPQFIKQ